MALQPFGDRFDGFRVGQHSRLQRLYRICSQNRVQLRRDEIGRYRMYGADPEGILRRQRGEYGAAVQSVRMESAEVRLHPRIAARVAARYGQAAWMYRIRAVVHDVSLSVKLLESIIPYCEDMV